MIVYYSQMLTPQMPLQCEYTVYCSWGIAEVNSGEGRVMERLGWIRQCFRFSSGGQICGVALTQKRLKCGSRTALEGGLDEIPNLHHSSFNKALHKRDKTTVFFSLSAPFFYFPSCGSTWCCANWHTARMTSVSTCQHVLATQTTISKKLFDQKVFCFSKFPSEKFTPHLFCRKLYPRLNTLSAVNELVRGTCCPESWYLKQLDKATWHSDIKGA